MLHTTGLTSLDKGLSIQINLCDSLFSDLDQPTFNTSSQKSISIVEGRYLSVVCNATSNPNAEYRWTNSSGQIISGTRSLVFQAIKRSDAKAYTCIAVNAAGLETMSSLMVDVQCELKVYASVSHVISYVSSRHLPKVASKYC